METELAREQAPAIGGAEATLKRIDYIEEEAENVVAYKNPFLDD